MAGFVVCKNGDDFVIAVASPNGNFNLGEKSFNKNNSSLQVINHTYGKIVVACPTASRIGQLIRINKTKLFDKKNHINYFYLKNKFFPRITEVLKDSNLSSKSKENGLPQMITNLAIIAEGKAYYVRFDGYIKEQDYLGCTCTQEAMLFSMKDDYAVHDEKFAYRVLLSDSLIRRDFTYGIELLSTKNYKIKFVSTIKEEL